MGHFIFCVEFCLNILTIALPFWLEPAQYLTVLLYHQDAGRGWLRLVMSPSPQECFGLNLAKPQGLRTSLQTNLPTQVNIERSHDWGTHYYSFLEQWTRDDPGYKWGDYGPFFVRECPFEIIFLFG